MEASITPSASMALRDMSVLPSISAVTSQSPDRRFVPATLLRQREAEPTAKRGFLSKVLGSTELQWKQRDRRGLPARVLAVEMILAATQAITGSYARAGRQQDLACPTAANARSRRKRLFRELSNPTRRSPDSRACRSRPVMEWRKTRTGEAPVGGKHTRLVMGILRS